MAIATNNGAAMIEKLRPKLENAFKDIPPFGEVGFKVYFNESEPVRIEYSAVLSCKLAPKCAR
jgi:hypothetical protein